MAGDPVGWDHDLFAELSELCARVDGIPDAVLEAARAAVAERSEKRPVGVLERRGGDDNDTSR